MFDVNVTFTPKYRLTLTWSLNKVVRGTVRPRTPMRDPSPLSGHRSRSSLSTSVLGHGVLFTQMVGYIGAELADAELRTFRNLLLEHHPPQAWIIDTERLEGFDPRAVKAGAAWFSSFRGSGGRQVVHVSRGSAARMVAQTLGFSVGLRVTSVDDYETARLEAGLPALSQRAPLAKAK